MVRIDFAHTTYDAYDVIDTSVAVKWFYHKGEQNVTDALRVFQVAGDKNATVMVPDIFLYELGNVFVRARKIETEMIEENFRIFSRS